nr:hypothetical protein [uncultured Noviherbaspirillum sp.]
MALFLAWPLPILLASFIGGKDWFLCGDYLSHSAVASLFAMAQDKRNWRINLLKILCFYLSHGFSAGSHLSEQNLAKVYPIAISIIISIFYVFFFSHRKRRE